MWILIAFFIAEIKIFFDGIIDTISPEELKIIRADVSKAKVRIWMLTKYYCKLILWD